MAPVAMTSGSTQDQTEKITELMEVFSRSNR
jgi:hypothetical protein